MHDDDQLAWLALLRAPRVGPATLNPVLAACPDAQQLLRHPPEGIPQHLRDYLHQPDWPQAEADLRWLQESQTQLLTITDEQQYPPLLRSLSAPPSVLFYKGDLNLLHMPQLAVVGSRNASRGGCATGHQFCAYLARHGMTITSGLAQGIDTIAHQGALSVEGGTIAVMGTGLDRVYPASNHDLAHEIADKGVLVSEYLPGTRPFKGNFPQRNRIIAGLSMGVLVVEAARKSGSLITARLAAELGREVFAIPGSIHNPMARGCHQLIRDGAKLVDTAEHIVEEFGAALASLQESITQPPAVAATEAPSAEYDTLLEAMGFDPVTTDQLVERTDFSAAEISSMLLLMELKGQVSAMSGGLFIRGRT